MQSLQEKDAFPESDDAPSQERTPERRKSILSSATTNTRQITARSSPKTTKNRRLLNSTAKSTSKSSQVKGSRSLTSSASSVKSTDSPIGSKVISTKSKGIQEEIKGKDLDLKGTEVKVEAQNGCGEGDVKGVDAVLDAVAMEIGSDADCSEKAGDCVDTAKLLVPENGDSTSEKTRNSSLENGQIITAAEESIPLVNAPKTCPESALGDAVEKVNGDTIVETDGENRNGDKNGEDDEKLDKSFEKDSDNNIIVTKATDEEDEGENKEILKKAKRGRCSSRTTRGRGRKGQRGKNMKVF